MLRFRSLFALALPFAVACAAGNSSTGTFGGNGNTSTGGAGGATTTTTTTGSAGGNIGGGFTTGTGGGGGGAPVEFAAYAHAGKTLYTIDPKNPSAAPKLVGDFDCIGTTPDKAMLDLAVSDKGEIWGISYANIYELTLQGNVVHCNKKIPLPSGNTFFGLTFAPAGVLEAGKETLIAANTAGQLFKVDTTNGTLQQHGTFGNVPANDGQGNSYDNQGKAWELSGDIVFLANNGNPVGFATVRDCPNPPDTSGCNPTDTLLEIDMTKLKNVGSQSVTLKVRGQIVKSAGCGGDASVYQQTLGIAAWDDKVYGFSHNGAIIEIDNKNGTACQVVNTAGVFWNGAGVTTLAPVIKPPE